VNFKKYIEDAAKDFPKSTRENRVSPTGTPYVWLAYDFDEINEWYAKWLQDYEEKSQEYTGVRT